MLHHAPLEQAGWYRIGVPLETRSYELTGLAPAADALLSFDAVLAAANGAAAIPYEAAPDGSVQKRLLAQARSIYSRDNLSGPLPFGQVESLALPWNGYAKAFTPALLANVLQGRATDAILAEGGYTKLDGDDAWWIPSGRQVPSKEAFYLPVTFLDPFGNATTIAYDAYLLVVTQAINPVKNVVAAAYDYRVLAPSEVTDPNGNRVQARFDALGRVVATAVMGKKAGPIEGDTLDDPTTTFDYDLDRFRQAGKPSVVHARARSARRRQHAVAGELQLHGWVGPRGDEEDAGRARPGAAAGRGRCAGARRPGVARAGEREPTMGRDRPQGARQQGQPGQAVRAVLQRNVRVRGRGGAGGVGGHAHPAVRSDGPAGAHDLPNGTFSKVVFDPWKEAHFDPNDTVLESAWYQERQGLDPQNDPEGRAAKLAAAHANTPAVMHLDALGRTFRAIEDNGPAGQYATTTTFDVEGNPLAITDARGVVAMQRRFGMGKHQLWQKSCDAGERWMLADVGGAVLRGWDGRGFTRRAVYDEARRATHLYAQPAGGVEMLVERTVYGEALGNGAAAGNQRAKVYQHFDGAGVVTSAAYDFKGNLLGSERRLAQEYHAQVDWSALAALTDPAAIAAAAEATARGRGARGTDGVRRAQPSGEHDDAGSERDPAGVQRREPARAGPRAAPGSEGYDDVCRRHRLRREGAAGEDRLRSGRDDDHLCVRSADVPDDAAQDHAGERRGGAAEPGVHL